MAAKKDRVERFIEELKKEEMLRRNLYKHTWLSGSSTTIYPITIWQDEVVLQWNSNRPCNKFIEKMVKKFKDIIVSGYFQKSDGSCPSRIVFKLRDN